MTVIGKAKPLTTKDTKGGEIGTSGDRGIGTYGEVGGLPLLTCNSDPRLSAASAVKPLLLFSVSPCLRGEDSPYPIAPSYVIGRASTASHPVRSERLESCKTPP